MRSALSTLSFKLSFALLAMLWSICGHSLSFGSQNDAFLPVEKAFPFSYDLEENVLKLHWNTVPGHYLYRDKFSFEVTSPDGVLVGNPTYHGEAHVKNDPSFGLVEIYSEPLSIDLPIQSSLDTTATVLIKYQGCAEAGLCYPPQKINVEVSVSNNSARTLSQTSSPGVSNDQPSSTLDTDSASDISAFLENANTPLIIAMMFVIGFGLAFTPCVLPMVPILMSIIVGAGDNASKKRTMTLAFSYVQGMAISYTLLGVVVGLTGSAIQTSLQVPAVLFSFAALLLLLSLSMFGFYELQLPAFIRDKLTTANQKTAGGTVLGAGVMGVLAALLASPCVTAPLIGVLLYISTHGDPLLGGLALYSLAMGIGTPQLGVAALGSHVLPKPGAWMNRIKAIFGTLLMAIALFLIKHLLPPTLLFCLSGALLIIISVLIGALDRVEDDPKHWLRKGVGLTLLVLGAALVIKPILSVNQQHPGSSASIEKGIKPTKVARTMEELNAALAEAAQQNRPALVDFYADWCTACIEMEHTTFSDAKVRDRLSTYAFIKVDLTDNPHTDALTRHFDIFGPPAYLWFNHQGQEIKEARLMGYLDPAKFLAMMDRFQLL